MKKDYTHICIVLDASGSMECIENDIKGSFNTFLKKQKEAKGKNVFDLFQFANKVDHLVKSADLSNFEDDLMEKYTCSGRTALNDAVCIPIDTMGKNFAAMPEEERPENVLCVIITDGAENASHQFSAEDVKQRIEHQKNVYNWEFDFLAANQDAWETGYTLGLTRDQCMDFKQTELGIIAISERMCCRAEAVRSRVNSIDYENITEDNLLNFE